MNDFTLVKHGYDPGEVQNYIIRLKATYESKLAEQKDRIFYLKDQLDTFTNASENELITSLARAVERAKQIENSSRNIFELETKRLKLLYSRMEELINDIDNQTSTTILKTKLLNMIQDCNQGLEKNIKMLSETISLIDGEDPVRRLLQKITSKNRVNIGNIDNFISQPMQEPAKTQPVKEEVKKPTPQKKEPVKVAQSQPVLGVKAEMKIAPKPVGVMYSTEVVQDVATKNLDNTKNSTYENFFEEDSKGSTTFEKIMFKNNKKKKQSVITADLSYPTPNESGFDLKEAVNPKDDLSEIMKAFDFYPEEQNKNNKKKK